MRLELEIKHLIKEAVREIIGEKVRRGQLQQASKSKQSEPAKPPTVKEPLEPRDPNSILRPSDLVELLYVSKPTLWRWSQSGQQPSKIHLAG